MMISVIIPVYNMEKYLRQCLDSVINQTYKNLEIICVNDASTDSSLAILEEYAAKDNRIKIVNNEKNSKLGSSRNNGMKVAAGEWIHFLDADDYMELDAYEKLAEITEKYNDLDLIHFYWREFYTEDCFIKNEKKANPDFADRLVQISDENLMDVKWAEQVWVKLYSKKFIDEFGLKFNDYACFEDMEYSAETLLHIRNVYFMDEILINYRVGNPESLIGKCHEHLDCLLKTYKTVEKLTVGGGAVNEFGRKVLAREFGAISWNLWHLYDENLIDFKTYKNFLKKTKFYDLKDLIYSVRYVYCDEIMRYPAWVFEMKMFLRKISRKYCPCIHKIITTVNKKLRGY